jgi:hypothetical protein
MFSAKPFKRLADLSEVIQAEQARRSLAIVCQDRHRKNAENRDGRQHGEQFTSGESFVMTQVHLLFPDFPILWS